MAHLAGGSLESPYLPNPSADYPDGVLFYGVVSAQTAKRHRVLLRASPRVMVDEVREDEPLLAEVLRVEAIELG